MVDLPYPPGLLDSSAALPKTQQHQQYDGLRCRGVGNSIFPAKNEPNRRWSIERIFLATRKRRTGAPSSMNGTILLRSALKNRSVFFCRKECCRYLSSLSHHRMVIFNQEHLLGGVSLQIFFIFSPKIGKKWNVI